MIFSNLKDLSPEEYKKIMNRAKQDIQNVLPSVEQILKDVKEKGDEALRYYTKEFDSTEIQDFRVTKEEFKEAKKKVSREIGEALQKAQKNIEFFHRQQLGKNWFYTRGGARIGQILKPLESVGCYIPGGRAAYPSTVLMTVIPAKVADVERIVCVTPPRKDKKANELVLVACKICGVDEVYKVGGAQAIAALAFGTQTMPKVDKIIGPGNIYVTAAKKLVSDYAAVDNPAGPSEVLILADDAADAELIALDMIAQAEHDPNSSSVLITTSKELGTQVVRKLKNLRIERAEARTSLTNNAAVLIVDKLEHGIKFCNDYAPEHLQLMVRKPRPLLDKIKNAGSIFLGAYTPVACGDYASGTNHVLPTMGYARVYSGLGVNDFVKFVPVQEFNREALKKIGKTIITLAEAEGLHGHAESVRKRVES
ncbi:MAG: histidinol dehydrogenase [Candidatus Hydrothermarchaeota archaeon]|nr:histidinol dehydrogenase [Candidatus Hydrothermarchaeota archaeon]